MSGVLDSHLHVWDLDVSDYSWLGPQHGALHRSFSPAEAALHLAAADIDGAVLVQAEDSETDTAYLLEVAARFGFVVGVVGWVRLDKPGAAREQLDVYGHRLCGVRHLVHVDPRDNFLELPQVLESLRLLAERGLPFDVPDAWPRHWAAVMHLADVLPNLTVVVDHLGKPPREAEDMATWATALRAAAVRPNVVAKLSGLQAPGRPFTVTALRPIFEVALDAFGAERLMYGGDWPMTVPDGGYRKHWSVMRALLSELSPDERRAIEHGTAEAVYAISMSRLTDQSPTDADRLRAITKDV